MCVGYMMWVYAMGIMNGYMKGYMSGYMSDIYKVQRGYIYVQEVCQYLQGEKKKKRIYTKGRGTVICFES
jgi:hypothetical protein